MIPIPELTKIDVAFPAHALEWMPSWEAIPDEYKHDEAQEIASSWFFNGLPDEVEFYPREGVDAEKAFNALRATLSSYAPRHEHKMAAVAYMIDSWFSKVRNWREGDS